MPKLKEIGNKEQNSHSCSRNKSSRSTKSIPKQSPRSSLSRKTGGIVKTEYPKSKFK